MTTDNGMKKHCTARRASSYTALALMSVLLAPLVASAAPTLNLSLLSAPVVRPTSSASSEPGMQQTTISLGAPVSIRLELVNDGASAVTVFGSLDPAASHVSLYLVDASAVPQRFTATRWEVTDMLVRPRALDPGARLVHEDFLFGRRQPDGTHRYLFPVVGQYELFARFHNSEPDFDVESNHVTVTVDAPFAGWSDLEAAGIVPAIEGRSRSAAEAESRRAQLATIRANLPEDPWAPWLAP